jgi:hypothetical protein
MKLFFVFATLLFASETFASSVCLISINENVYDSSASKWVSELYVSCNTGNSDGQVIRKDGQGTTTTADIATAISSLLNKGYALVGQSEYVWTLTKN